MIVSLEWVMFFLISLQPFMAASMPFQNSPHPIPVFVVEHGQPLKMLRITRNYIWPFQVHFPAIAGKP